jgi:2,4-dienoyl-CoA reductase-like NADH-dependent reductase (Old Yellow Enzyme family)
MDVTALQTQASARGSAAGFVDSFLDTAALPGIEREKAKIFTPLRVGNLSLQHRVVHPAMGRSRSVHGAESPLAAEYFAQRTTPGSLIISQATGVSAESVAWPWAASLHNSAQQSALSHVIQAVHGKGGYWFQQLFHVGRCTTPALVKRARDQAGFYDPPSYGYRPISSSSVSESGFNTHSGENAGIPHALTIEEIHCLKDDFKNAARRAVDAGADGIEVGWPQSRCTFIW